MPEDLRTANRARFELELEFVQTLANPFYLHSLARQNILSQPAFVNFLRYLLYWKEKEYAKFIHYPHALHHLELLQHASFRAEIGKDEWREYLHQQQFNHWRHWREDPNRASNLNTNGVKPAGSNGVEPTTPSPLPPTLAPTASQSVAPSEPQSASGDTPMHVT